MVKKMVEEFEILDVREYPKPTYKGWENVKVITFKIGETEHEIEMPSKDYTAKNAKAVVGKAAKEILDTLKPGKTE